MWTYFALRAGWLKINVGTNLGPQIFMYLSALGQLLSIVEGMVELNQFEIDDEVTKTNKLKGITEMIINLDELNNSVNLIDGRPSNELLTYYVTDDKDLNHKTPSTKSIKMESLLL